MRVKVTINMSSQERDLLLVMSGSNQSAFIRGLILDAAKERGLPIPESTLKDTRGKYRRQTNKK
jgi:hypothetical protein